MATMTHCPVTNSLVMNYDIVYQVPGKVRPEVTSTIRVGH
jgi:hypothetical protein